MTPADVFVMLAVFGVLVVFVIERVWRREQ
jgi:hypothetical protein